MLKQRHWLELSEYGVLLLTFLSGLLALPTGQWQLTMILLWLALGLNVVNRLRTEKLNRQRNLKALQRLDYKLSQKIEGLVIPQAAAPKPQEHLSLLDENPELQSYLSSFEKSLTSVVQYLNQQAIAERLKYLEQELFLLTNQTRPSSLNLDEEHSYQPWAFQTLKSPLGRSQEWQCLHVIKAHQAAINALDMSRDGLVLGSVSSDQHLKFWSLATGKLICDTPAHEQGILAFCSTFAVNKTYYFASGGRENSIKFWELNLEHLELPKLNNTQVLNQHTASITALCSSHQGEIILSIAADDTFRQWHSLTGTLLNTHRDPEEECLAIAANHSGQIILTAGRNGMIKLWQWEIPNAIAILTSSNPSPIHSLAVSPDGQLIVAGCTDGKLRFWQGNLDNPETIPADLPNFSFIAHDQTITQVRFSTEDTLISSSADGTLKIWQLGSEQPLSILKLTDETSPDINPILSFSISPDGEILAAAGADGTLKIWLRE